MTRNYRNKNLKKNMCSVCPVLCDWYGKCSLFHVSVSDFGSIAVVLNVIAVFTWLYMTFNWVQPKHRVLFLFLEWKTASNTSSLNTGAPLCLNIYVFPPLWTCTLEMGVTKMWWCVLRKHDSYIQWSEQFKFSGNETHTGTDAER